MTNILNFENNNNNNNNKMPLLINETLSNILFDLSYISLYEENDYYFKEYSWQKEYINFCEKRLIGRIITTGLNLNK